MGPWLSSLVKGEPPERSRKVSMRSLSASPEGTGMPEGPQWRMGCRTWSFISLRQRGPGVPGVTGALSTQRQLPHRHLLCVSGSFGLGPLDQEKPP